MRIKVVRKFLEYLYSNYVGNFIGFAIGMASTRVVAYFFTTKSIHNLWGLTAHKTIVTKHTYSNMEWGISLVIGFIVFELISKWLKKKMDEILPRYKMTEWLVDKPEDTVQ